MMVMFQVSMISDEDILKLKDLPIWFTHAKTDPVVVPDDFVVPTYEPVSYTHLDVYKRQSQDDGIFLVFS